MLINRHSHSNSANVAALAQDYGFATVLGEATSDLVTTYGAMEHFKLPKTGILVGFPKAHIIRPRGDARPSGVMPDIEIEDPVVTTARDAMLDEAIRIVHSKI
jgi:C-terminal processing protease CtpA/Prc